MGFDGRRAAYQQTTFCHSFFILARHIGVRVLGISLSLSLSERRFSGLLPAPPEKLLVDFVFSNYEPN